MIIQSIIKQQQKIKISNKNKTQMIIKSVIKQQKTKNHKQQTKQP